MIFVAEDKPKSSVTNFRSFSSSVMASFGASIFHSCFVVCLEGPRAPDALKSTWTPLQELTAVCHIRITVRFALYVA